MGKQIDYFEGKDSYENYIDLEHYDLIEEERKDLASLRYETSIESLITYAERFKNYEATAKAIKELQHHPREEYPQERKRIVDVIISNLGMVDRFAKLKAEIVNMSFYRPFDNPKIEVSIQFIDPKSKQRIESIYSISKSRSMGTGQDDLFGENIN